MFYIKNLSSRIVGREKIKITWESEESTDVVYRISRSYSPLKSAFKEIGNSESTNEFIDSEFNYFQKNTEIYYMVDAVLNGEIEESYMCGTAKSLEERIPQSLSRKKNLMFRVKLKNIGKMYIKTPETGPCPECWDFEYRESKNRDCPVCGGTGRLSPYLSPIEVGYTMGKAYITTRKTETSEEEPVHANLEIATFHTFKSGDIFMDKYNVLWKVDNSSPEHFRSDFSQTLLIKRLDRDIPEYNIFFEGGS